MSEILYRSNLVELEIQKPGKGGDGRTVEGIAVPYDRAQRINDSLTEQFARSAFAHQLAAMHRVHYAREHVSQGGSAIGRLVEARDDAAGLFVRMRVSKTPLGEETLTLIQDEVLTELSIGFRSYPRRDEVLRDGTVVRRKADLTEVATVLRGAYGQGARVTAVRAEQQDGRMNAQRAAALLAGVPLLPAEVLTS